MDEAVCQKSTNKRESSQLQDSMNNANDMLDIYMLCTLIPRHAFRSCPPFLLQGVC